jgi:phage shock protein A
MSEIVEYLRAHGQLRLEAEYEELLRDLAEVTAERDAALALAKRFETRQGKLVVMSAEVRVRAETAEAALSRRDEALRVAREALDRIVEHGSAMGPAGTATMLEIARAALALDALTKPQGDGDAGENG